MFLSVLGIAALAFWDEERESAAALADFAQEQTLLARSLGLDLQTRLLLARHGALPVGGLLSGLDAIERPAGLLVLVRSPDGRDLHTTSGRPVQAERMVAALRAGATSLRLLPQEAGRLGLPPRTALAGLMQVDAGPEGIWGIAVVKSAVRERDRERRARWRLILGVLTAGGLVFAFGGVALRKQRTQLMLERELFITEVQRERDERLERASRAATLGTLAMGITHELSTPLSIISGRAEQLLSRLGGDERASQGVRVILEQTDRISRVIRGFLGLARGDAPSIQRIDPCAVSAGALGLVEHKFAQAGVILVSAVPREMPPLSGDQRLLEQALVNLLLNACDACREGGRVEVAAACTPDHVRFTVTDDGAGCPPQDAERLLLPFFTTKPAGQGAGLGLAIANEIVKSHRGTLSIGPRTGPAGGTAGTVAEIRIPLAQIAASEGAPR